MEEKGVHTSEYKSAVQAPHSGIVCAKGWEVALRIYHHAQSLELAHREVVEEQKTRIGFHQKCERENVKNGIYK